MASINDWINAANNLKNKTTNDYINQNQGIINSINQQRDAELQGLSNSNQQTINQLNLNKNTVNQTALDNAKAANVNRLLALKDNKNAMSRAGLSSQGLVGSQVNSINNNYGTNLNSILKDKATGLRDIDNQITNANLTYDTNRANLAAQYASTLANQQASINNAATQLGLQAYNDYISQQQAYANYEQQRQEAERQNALAWAQLNASKSNNNFSDSGFSNNNYQVNTAYYQGGLNPDTQYGTFGTKDKNGMEYQPNNIGGKKLTSSGKTAGQIFGQNAVNSSGVNIANQKVWKLDNKYYIWNGSKNQYERVK